MCPTASRTTCEPWPPVSSRTLRDAVLAAFGDDVGGAELASQVGAYCVAAHEDDLLGAEPFGREHRHQADRAVADHRDPVPRGDPALVAA